MSDLAAVVMALASAGGAWVGWGLSGTAWLLTMALLALALWWRRPAMLIVAVALAASGLSARSHAGLHPPLVGRYTGVVTLVGDPSDVGGAVRADVRLGTKRVEAWARGRAAGRLSSRLTGEQLAVVGVVRPVRGPARVWLARRHVVARMSLDEVGGWSWGGPVSRTANRMRRSLLAGAESMSYERRALLAGFVLGDDRGQPPEITSDFRAAGLTHLLAVSGENVAFVLALVAPLLRRLRLSGRLVVGVAVLVAFGVLTRWEPSVLRAIAMASLSLLATTLGRPVSRIRLLALAVTGLLLIDPLLVGSVGFGLSVGACVGIALLARPIALRLPGPRPVAEVLAVTLAAQIGVAPVLIPVFGGLPVASVPANLLAVPVAGALMMWGMGAGMIAGLAGEPLARLVHGPTNLALAWEAGVARWAASLPLGQLGGWHLIVLTGLALTAVAWCRRWPQNAAGPVVAVILSAAVVLAPASALARSGPLAGRPMAPGVKLWRQGPATVLVVENSSAPPALVLSGLRANAVRRLDALVVARPGRASVGLATAILARLPARLVLVAAGQEVAGGRTPPAHSRTEVGPLWIDVDEASPALMVRVTVLGTVGGDRELARPTGPPR